jgi:hypothetical protein
MRDQRGSWLIVSIPNIQIIYVSETHRENGNAGSRKIEANGANVRKYQHPGRRIGAELLDGFVPLLDTVPSVYDERHNIVQL